MSLGRRIRDGKGASAHPGMWMGRCIFIVYLLVDKKVQIESARDLLSEKKILISQISRKPSQIT